MKSGNFRLRKTSNVEQEAVVYELVDEASAVLLDVTKTDVGVFEVCIIDNQGEGRAIELGTLLDLIEDAKGRIEADDSD